ncbi:MAG: ribosome biogenesis GTP-binding protein YihA/YsxC [Ignavibacteria bacterium]|nr:ribosome biogenesis GTP-binding protein YihA/YsxC [Ignavibacteria bacterium]
MKITSAEFVTGAVSLSQLPDGARKEIAFLGRSNVGKSSLISSLCKIKKIARSGRTPGKTREINYFLINNQFYFVDLPGYGYARLPDQMRASLGALIEGYLQNRKSLAFVIQLIDARHEPTELDKMMVGWLDYYGVPFEIVLTKSDKLARSRKAACVKEAELVFSRFGACRGVLLSSSDSGEGRKEILQVLSEYC